jgi:tight adherence protein B
MMDADLWAILLLATALGAILLIALVLRQATAGRVGMRRRVKALGVAFARTAASSAGAGDSLARRQLIQGKLRELERQRQRSRRDTPRQLLLQSGMPLTLRGFVFGSVAAAVVTGAVMALAGWAPLVWLLGAAGAGLLLPRLALRIVVRRRQARFTRHFADALDIMVRGVRSGLPVAECLRIVARESPDPVGPEFQLFTESQRLGMTLKQALDRAVERMPVTELQFFSIVLQVQQQTGGNLAATLDNLSGVLRGRKRLLDKIQAMSSEAKASATIIGALPFLVCGGLWLGNPEYIALLFSQRLGNVMLGGCGIWMLIGIVVMHKMIHFEQ